MLLYLVFSSLHISTLCYDYDFYDYDYDYDYSGFFSNKILV